MTERPPVPPARASRPPDGGEIPTLIADPRAYYGTETDLTPVMEPKAAAKPAARSKVGLPAIALAVVAVLALGILGYRIFARASFAKVAAAATGRPMPEPEAAKPTPIKAVEEIPEAPPVLTPATPAEAARSFALGEYELALQQYRFLADESPEADVYKVMVKVLSARTEQR